MTRPSSALIELVVELHELSPSDRRSILGRFEPFEREVIEDCLRKTVEPTPPSFDALAGLSPWLVESLGAARAVQSGLTHATCDALLEAELLLPRAASSAEPSKPSLVERVLAMGGRK